jgi:hypothetical protein
VRRRRGGEGDGSFIDGWQTGRAVKAAWEALNQSGTEVRAPCPKGQGDCEFGQAVGREPFPAPRSPCQLILIKVFLDYLNL